MPVRPAPAYPSPETSRAATTACWRVFILDQRNLKTIAAAAERLLNLHTEIAMQFFWRGRNITIETEPDQPVWTDGEYFGRTPVSMSALQGKLSVVVAG